ncbi:MAG: NAD(P)-binding protein, partial [Acidobacteriota bacterium]
MEKRIGIQICTGCGIGEALDTHALESLATGELGVSSCSKHAFLCGEEGAASIKASLSDLDALVIAGCSPRVMTDVFDFGPEKLVERVNLREQVVWSHPAGDEDTQMMAEDQLRMAVTRVKEMQPPVPFMGENLSKRILVVGGGLAGLTAASEAAKAGYEAVIVEKSDQLGGYLKNVYKLPPSQPPY